jgi:hypothetical protein
MPKIGLCQRMLFSKNRHACLRTFAGDPAGNSNHMRRGGSISTMSTRHKALSGSFSRNPAYGSKGDLTTISKTWVSVYCVTMRASPLVFASVTAVQGYSISGRLSVSCLSCWLCDAPSCPAGPMVPVTAWAAPPRLPTCWGACRMRQTWPSM